MKILVTAGNTQTPIDQVRCITNIFTGRTGTYVAWECFQRGHEVDLLTSHPDLILDISRQPSFTDKAWQVFPYRTFDDLSRLLEEKITHNSYDVIIHVAAVSDYSCAGSYTLNTNCSFDSKSGTWQSESPPVTFLDAAANKIKSHHPELWLRLLPTPKLIDCMRTQWNFRGILVKFKLEAGVSDDELKAIAIESRSKSEADLIVANTLEEKDHWAIIGDRENQFICVDRKDIARFLLEKIESYRLSANRREATW